MTPHRLFAAAAAVLAVSAPAAAVLAHARLVSSTPVANATVASPGVISLTFSERMLPAFSSFDLVDAAGRHGRRASCRPH